MSDDIDKLLAESSGTSKKTKASLAKLLLDSVGASDGTIKDGVLQKRVKKIKQPPAAPPSGLVDWDNVSSPLKHAGADVKKWNRHDFLYYLHDLYLGVFHCMMPTNFRATLSSLNRVRVYLGRIVGDPKGECDCEVMKAYLDFYFSKYAEIMVARNGWWDADYLSNSKCMNEFLALWKAFQPSPPAKVSIPVSSSPSVEPFNSSDIELSSKIGHRALLSSYGLVIASNYFIKTSKLSREESLNQIVSEVVALLKRDSRFWVNIRSATMKYQPYPQWLSFIKVEQMVSKIQQAFSVGTLVPITIAVVNNDKRFTFLR